MDYNFSGFVLFTLTVASFLVTCHAIRVGVSTSSNNSPISVIDKGAIGDGKQDDTQAFVKAWEAVCSATGDSATLSVPAGKTFLLNAIQFQGPCKSDRIHIEIKGKIVAHDNIGAWKNCKDNSWIDISYVDGLTIDGHGEIDGKGSIWWSNDATTLENGDGSCKRPAGIRFGSCKGFRLSNIAHKNSPGRHIGINGCDNSAISNIRITAPEDSPNTDGIDISSTKHFEISRSVIGTGDDCVAIGSDSSFINISEVVCGPGHGISVGSLGKDGAEARVEEIHVKNCTFKNTQCGARIKTWQGGKGYARKITYDDITLLGTGNPIMIDQFYCPHSSCTTQGSAVAISDVRFSRFRGSSGTDVAITLNCSETVPCEKIKLENISIGSESPSKRVVSSSCQNVHGSATSVQPHVQCM